MNDSFNSRSTSLQQVAGMTHQRQSQTKTTALELLTQSPNRTKLPESPFEAIQARSGSRADSHQFRADMQRMPAIALLATQRIPTKPKFRGLSHELAAKNATAQLRLEYEEEETLQENFSSNVTTVQLKDQQTENNTGLPDHLKTGIENLSGMALDDVKVHYNSSKPAELQALAYTQGVDIHVASGQEKHLPHEAWHVVQQKQGRVQPTLQTHGVLINEDCELEREADVIGAKALQIIQPPNTHQIDFIPKENNGTKSNRLIQKKARFSNYKESRLKTIWRKFEEFERKEEISESEKLSKYEISQGLPRILESAEDFGAFDLEDYQQIGLLYHFIGVQLEVLGKEPQEENDSSEKKDQREKRIKTKIEDEEKLKKKEEIEKETFKTRYSKGVDIDGFFKLALLGRGSSIAYYLTSLGTTYDHQYTLIVGTEDPWKNKRGKDWFVNHPLAMIEPWSSKLPKSQFKTRDDEYSEHSPEEIFAPRSEFAEKNEEAIEAAKIATNIKDSVKKVSRIQDLDKETLSKLLFNEFKTFDKERLLKSLKWRLGEGFNKNDFIIETGEGKFFAAKKVVMGTGGGSHAIPEHTKIGKIDDTRKESDQQQKKEDVVKNSVMDMDTFMRLPKTAIKDKKVVVQGVNAGIDAVDRAEEDGGEIVAWLGGEPPFLHKTLIKYAPSSKVLKKRVDTARNSEKISILEHGLSITFTKKTDESNKDVNSPIAADYFVYAIGQDINAEDEYLHAKGPGAILSEGIKNELKGEGLGSIIKGGKAGAFDKSFGLGLHLGKEEDNEQGLTIIGAAAWRLSKDKSIGILTESIDKMATVVPSNVVGYEQLGALKSSVGAMNAFIPQYISKGFDWLTADPNMIRVFLAIQHPDLKEELAEGFIKGVIQLRRLYPNGVPEQVQERLLTKSIKQTIALEMALETANFLTTQYELNRDKKFKSLKSIYLYSLSEIKINEFLDKEPSYPATAEIVKNWLLSDSNLPLPDQALPQKV